MALTYKSVALATLKEQKKIEREYRETCREYAEKGYRPHHCIHGTNLWTDYDNICFGCEESLGTYEMALMRYHAVVDEVERRRSIAKFDNSMSSELWNSLMDWMLEPLMQFKKD